ncbi:MAG: thiamine pyrophosphate-dependent enzyme [Patescibacteria group bacterium]
MPYQMPFKYLLNPGHTACAGCGELLAMRHVLEASGSNTLVAGATGCSEVTTSKYPTSSFKVPWIHANFENSAPLISGILASYDFRGEKAPNLIAWGGDGATFDIGLGMLSGAWERGENFLYVCFDNEAYMNTGVQASGSTPINSNTTTTPPGKRSSGNNLLKKDMVKIALAHNLQYVATATVGNVLDIQNKVRKALTFSGPKFLQILVTCVPGWYTESKDTVKVASLAQKTGVFPVVEYVDGQLVGVARCPNPRPRVEEYLKLQGRFKHLFNSGNEEEIKKIQDLADKNVEKFGL